MKATTLGLIGLGHWGKIILANLVEQHSDKTILCSGTNDRQTKQWLTHNYPSVQFINDPLMLILAPEVSHVFIATPIETHYSYALKALESNKHVFVEKPATKSYNQTNRLITTARKNDKILFIDHLYSAHPCFRKLLSEVRHKPIIKISFNWNKFGSFKENIFWNLLYHDLYLLQELVDEPLSIESVTNDCGFLSSNDVTTVQISSVSTKITIHINRVHKETSKSILVSTANEMYCWHKNELIQFNTAAQKYISIFQDESSSLLKNQIQTFFNLTDVQHIYIEKHHKYSLVATKLIEDLQNR